MGDFFKSNNKNSNKKLARPILIGLGIPITVIILLAGSVYFLTIDDGTYTEDDWASVPFASNQYTQKLKVTTDGNIASNYTLQEIWENMDKSKSRVSLYLNSPKELAQMMYAEMVTQLPDLREDTSKIRTMEEWKETFDNFIEEDTKYQTFSGGSKGNAGKNSGSFNTFDLSESELRGLTAVALHEQGSTIGAAAEASLMANLYESSRGQSFSGIVNYVLDSGWFNNAHAHYNDSGIVNDEALAAVKSVLIDGKRTVPGYVDEHDYRGDIASATNDGAQINIYDNSQYIPHKTIINNTMGSTYTFYCFPTETSDPFGYTSSALREEMGDNCYGLTNTSMEETGYKTNLQGGIIRLTRNLVTGKTEIPDSELKKMETDYDNYRDDYELKQKKKEKDKKEKEQKEKKDKEYEELKKKREENKKKDKEDKEDKKDKEEDKEEVEDKEEKTEESADETDEEESVDEAPLLSFEEWMKQRGYTKNNGKWERNGSKISMTYAEPKTFNQYIKDYRNATNEKDREAAKQNLLSHFTLERGEGSNNRHSKANSLDGFLFIGDSITEGLSSASLNDENKKVMEGVKYKSKVGVSARYWLENINELPSAEEVKGVCVMLGVNNPGDISGMQKLIEKLSSKYSNVQIYIEKVLPVGKGYNSSGNNASTMNTSINKYNSEIQEYCNQLDNVSFIDTTEGYIDDEGNLSTEMSELDSLHLKATKYDTLVENIATEICGQSAFSPEATTKVGNLTLNQKALESDPDFTNNKAWKDSDSPYNTPALWGQCTWFAWGKFYEIYGFSPGFSGNGVDCVDQLIDVHPDKFEKSDTPTAGSVFSYNNHVGIVLDVDGNNITIQDGNYNGVSDPWDVAITDWQTNTYTLEYYRGQYSDIVFANPIGASVSSNQTSSTQYNIKIATFKEVTTTYTTNDPADIEGGSYGPDTVYTVTTESINYYDMVKQYTMPFDYLWSLLVISEDRGFVFELLRTIYESDIEITVNDNLDDTTVVTTNSYTVTETLTESGTVWVTHAPNPTKDEYINGIKPKSTEEPVKVSIENQEISNNTYTSTKTVRTVTNTVDTALTRANVWIVDYTKNYTYKEEPESASSSSSSLGDINHAYDKQPSDDQLLIEQAKSQVTGIVEGAKLGRDVVGHRDYSKHDRTQTVTTKTKVKGYEEGEKYLREKTQKVLKEKKKEKDKTEFVEKKEEVDIFTDIEDVDEKDKLTEEDIEEIKKEEKEDTDKKDVESEKSDKEDKDTDSKKDDKEDKDTDSKKDDKEDKDSSDTDKDDKGTEGEEPVIEWKSRLSTRFATNRTFRYKEKNFVTLLSTYEFGRRNTLNVASWLFELLENNEATVEMVDLTKYLLYKVTNSKKYGVTEFDFSIYEPAEFSDMDGIMGNTPQEKVWYSLRKAGFSEQAAAGVLGNIQNESGFDPSVIEGGSGIGFGLCQWSYGRRTQIEAYAASKGVSATDIDTQIEFLIAELTPGGGAGGYATYQLGGASSTAYDGKAYTGNDFKNAKTPEAAAMAFMALWERPSYDASINHMDRRKADAKRYYDEFKGRPLSSFIGGSGKITNVENSPNYCQWSGPWAQMAFGGQTVAHTGCVPTSAAIAITALTGKQVTPDQTCQYAYSNRLYNSGATPTGAGPAAAEACARHWGLNAKITDSLEEVEKALKNGKAVVAIVIGTDFYSGSHGVCILGYKNGETFVRDPNHPTAPGSKWYSLRNYIWPHKNASFTIIG